MVVRRTIPSTVVNYLMQGDHTIRWQVLDQLVNGDAPDIHYERMMIELEGWGHQLLDLQDENGLWNQSLVVNQYQSSLWVMIQLKRYGIYPIDQFYLSCEKIISELTFDGAIMWEGKKEKHTCLAGLTLMVCCYFRYLHPKVEAIYHYLIETQQEDGSWNCPYHEDIETRVFATTLAALEGLHEYQKIYRTEYNRIADMQRTAHEFLLKLNLNRKSTNTTEEYLSFSDFSFPFLRYDLLTVLDYFRTQDVKYDPRMKEALLYIKNIGWNYRWRLDTNTGEECFDFEPSSGFSRYNTLRAIRVLHHYGKL